MSAILFLHGGGHSDHTRYTKLEEKFHSEKIITHSFDHRATSLAGRLTEAEQELTKLKSKHHLDDTNIFIWGSSMGGHVACRLVESHPDICGLILQSAAAYSKKAENISFGSSFTAEISKENSWLDSPVFTSISKYKNPILVMYGEFDDVIPAGIKEKYISRARMKGDYRILSGSGHSLLRPHISIEFNAWEQMYDYALNFIKSVS